MVIDGAKALRKAVRDLLRVHTPVQRCVVHEDATCSGTWPTATSSTPHTSGGRLVAGGMQATLPVTRLGVRGRLERAPASTKPCASLIDTVRRVARTVKRWSSGDMCLRWTAAGMLEAQTQFHRIIGNGDLAQLAVAVEGDVSARRAADTPVTTTHTPTTTAAPEVAATPA